MIASISFSVLQIFGPLQPELQLVPAFFRYHLTWSPVTAACALYLVGGKLAILFGSCGFALLVGSFYSSMGGIVTFPLHTQDHFQFLLIGAVVQLVPVICMLSFENETKLYHTLLLKCLKDAEEKSKAKTTFISRMSHELRTPLQGLLSSATLLKESKLTEDQRIFTEIIDSCGELLLNVMDKILDITRIESGRFDTQIQPFSLLDLVPTLLESVVGMASAKGVELFVHFDLGTESFVINGDQKHLRGILTNVRSK